MLNNFLKIFFFYIIKNLKYNINFIFKKIFNNIFKSYSKNKRKKYLQFYKNYKHFLKLLMELFYKLQWENNNLIFFQILIYFKLYISK